MNNLVILAFVASSLPNSQSKGEAVKKTEFERYEEADKDFRDLMGKTDDPTLYYYFGNNFIGQNQIDSALKYYQLGKVTYPNEPLNFIGIGKVALINKNETEANESFQTALSLANDNRPDINRELARAYIDFEIKQPDKAIVQIEKAINLDPKNPRNYIILGDAQIEKDPANGSAAIKNYKIATALNPNSTIGMLKTGKLYQRGRNYQLALEKYKEALAIDSNYAPAYREIAELYSSANQPKLSIEYWRKYLVRNNSDYAHYRFLSALFSDQQYLEAIDEYNMLKEKNYSNLFMERLAAYSYYEIGDEADKDAYARGLLAIMRFFDMAGENFKYLASDYKYKGLLLLKNGNERQGREAIQKAVELDADIEADIRTELSSICWKEKKYECVINQLQLKRIALKGDLSNAELFDLGRAYYYASSELINESKSNVKLDYEYLDKLRGGDITFKTLCVNLPDWIFGYLWRARCNALLYPNIENDTAKDLYETVVKLFEKEGEQNKNYLIEAYEYLGYYYVTKGDKVNADIVWSRVKELQPENKKQRDYFKYSESKKSRRN
ncbi:MAG TPA: hypothetical protein PLQ93_12275 [Bacteroidia bacterium]|nr:hypothetical protein [Bacteroidia bacterium]